MYQKSGAKMVLSLEYIHTDSQIHIMTFCPDLAIQLPQAYFEIEELFSRVPCLLIYFLRPYVFFFSGNDQFEVFLNSKYVLGLRDEVFRYHNYCGFLNFSVVLLRLD